MGFVPVLHSGYLKFFRAHRGGKLWLFAEDLYGEFEHLTREIRALRSEEMKDAISALRILSHVEVLTANFAKHFFTSGPIVMPDEDISRYVAEKYFSREVVKFEPWKLRFDMPASLSKCPPEPDRTITVTEFDREMIRLAHKEAEQSPDWWRQVGAVCVRDGKVLYTAYNTHMPSEQSLYALGDPRNNFKAGEHLDISCAHHAERSIVAVAAGDGTALAGSDLYVTTFPCPACAYCCIKARIRRIYYRDGYSALEAAESCKANGVELIRVLSDK